MPWPVGLIVCSLEAGRAGGHGVPNSEGSGRWLTGVLLTYSIGILLVDGISGCQITVELRPRGATGR